MRSEKALGVPSTGRALSILWHFRHELAAVTVAGIAAFYIVRTIMGYPHPPGADGGQWLGIAHGMLGTGVSSIAPLNYPPLYFLLLSLLWKLTGDPIAALQASIAVIVFLIPLSAYATYALITRDRRGALLFSVLIAFCFPFYEMLDWGAYPSLFSFVFLLPAFAFLVRSSLKDAPRREHLLLGLFAGLTFLTHPLSALLFSMVALSYFVLLQIGFRDRKWFVSILKSALPVFGLLVAPYYLLRVATSGTGAASGTLIPNYLLSVPAYPFSTFFFPLVPWPWRKLFPFTSDFAVLLIAVVSLLALYPLGAIVRRRTLPPGAFLVLRTVGRERATRASLLFVSTLLVSLLTPLLMWKSGIYTDYSRFGFYACFPLASVAAAAGSRMLSVESWSAALAWLHRRMPSKVLRMLSRKIAAAGDPVRAEEPARSSSDGRKAPLARLSRPRLARLAAAAILWIVVTLPLQAYASFSLDYHQKTAAYYSQYNEPADVDLARWAAANSDRGDLFVLAPGFGNDFWFEGLSGRPAVGYTWENNVYYENQVLTNRDLLHIFGSRYGAAGGSLEMVTPGAGDWQPTRFRLLAYDGMGSHVALDMIDSESYLVVDGNRRESFSGFAESGMTAVRTPLGEDGFSVDSALPFDGTRLTRTAVALPDGVDLRLRSTGPNGGATSFVLTLRPTTPACGIVAEPGSLTIGVRAAGSRCIDIRLEGEPAISAGCGKVSGTTYCWVTIPLNSTGEAGLRFRTEDARPSVPAPSGLIDSAELVERYSPCSFVALVRTTGLAPILVSGLGLPIAYQNSKYLVVRAVGEATVPGK